MTNNFDDFMETLVLKVVFHIFSFLSNMSHLLIDHHLFWMFPLETHAMPFFFNSWALNLCSYFFCQFDKGNVSGENHPTHANYANSTRDQQI
jgi:hypothetical protein